MYHLLYFLTSILYILSFPNFNIIFLAWICLVPLIIAVDKEKNIFCVVRNCFISGWIIYLGAMYWLTNVTWLGYFLVTLYLALYIVLFGAIRFYNKNFITIPLAWTALEFMRSNFLGGIPWLLLGASQYNFLPLIQISNITGVYGVSFVVAFVNAGIARRRRGLLISVFIFGAVMVYGFYYIHRPVEGQRVKIGIVQPNVPQDVKWDPAYTDWMLERLTILTKQMSNTELIIWPETAVPTLTESADVFKRVSLLAKEINSFLITGSQGVDSGARYYNSAFLISNNGNVIEEYRKIHLVPFGEFVPFGKVFPFLKRFTPIEEGFTAGNEYTVFRISSRFYRDGLRISALICFEDIFPELARKFIQKGADILVNITNDGWFGKTNAVYQHAYLSVFRAVENGVPLVRATNTGLSCFIEYTGKMHVVKPFVEVSDVREILVPKGNTFYTRYGDVFGWLCAMMLTIGGIYVRRDKKKAGSD